MGNAVRGKEETAENVREACLLDAQRLVKEYIDNRKSYIVDFSVNKLR